MLCRLRLNLRGAAFPPTCAPPEVVPSSRIGIEPASLDEATSARTHAGNAIVRERRNFSVSRTITTAREIGRGYVMVTRVRAALPRSRGMLLRVEESP